MTSLKVQNQKTLRVNNCRLVLQLLRDNRSNVISRADIAKATEMSPTSITRITRELLDMNLVKQEKPFSNGVGRNGVQISMNENAFYSAGVSIDSDYVRVCIVNCVDEMIAEASEQLEKRYSCEYTPEEIFAMAKKLLDDTLQKEGIAQERIQAVGVASAGNLDYETGYINFASQMGWDGFSIRALADETFGRTTCIDNDVKMSLIGATYQFPEMRSSDSLYLSIGAGVGAAVMYGGKMLRGVNNAVGEVGHIKFGNGKKRCVCGQVGCAYTYVSAPALLDMCREKGHPVENLACFSEALDCNETWTEPVLEEYTQLLSTFISDMVYIYNPQYLLVGGTVITTHPAIYERTKAKIKFSIHDTLMKDVIIKKRELENNAALGAACAASERQIIQMIENYD